MQVGNSSQICEERILEVLESFRQGRGPGDCRPGSMMIGSILRGESDKILRGIMDYVASTCGHSEFLQGLFSEDAHSADNVQDYVFSLYRHDVLVLSLGAILTKVKVDDVVLYDQLFNCIPIIRRCIANEVYVHSQHMPHLFPNDNKIRVGEIRDLLVLCKRVNDFENFMGLTSFQLKVRALDIVKIAEMGGDVVDSGIAKLCINMEKILVDSTAPEIHFNILIEYGYLGNNQKEERPYKLMATFPTHKELAEMRLMLGDSGPFVRRLSEIEFRDFLSTLCHFEVPLHLNTRHILRFDNKNTDGHSFLLRPDGRAKSAKI